MHENFVYSECFTNERRCPVKPGMTAGGAGMTMVGIGGARSDANEANDMQKLVFVYLSRRASHLCKPGMTMEERG